MKIQEFFDQDTYTLTYVVYQEGSKECVVIDPVLDFDPASGKITETSVNQVLDFLTTHHLKPVMCLETHAHADHLSGSQVLKRHYQDMKVGISERITLVQKVFVPAFHLDAPSDGRQFDYLFKDHEELEMRCFAMETPGHTPACSSYLIEDAVFTGDALFMPDYGVGRCDFPAGSPEDLYDSITNNIYTLPDHTRVFTGHDYQPGGRPVQFESSVKEQKESNLFLNRTTSKSEFVQKRTARDKSLPAPTLLLPSIQVNVLAGHLPEPESNGTRYLRLPLKISGTP